MHADNATHEDRNRKNSRCDVDGEAGVVEKRIEHDANALTATDDTEAVEGYDEEKLRSSGEADSEVHEDGEKETGNYFKRYLEN